MLLALCASGNAQTAEEEGKVPFNGQIVDLAGQPVRGVMVYTIDRNFHTVSDKKGRFGLTNVLPNDTVHLLYHRTHYAIPVNGRKSMRIIMGDQIDLHVEQSTDMENLGYGWVSRRESVSSSQGISGELLRRTGRSNLLDALQGLVPGLQVLGDGGPTGQKVIIRGIGTINGSTDPLFIVDGVEVSSLDFLNVYDIECVEVMKDAFIYGSRGANGAILVTTKK